jgi:hypothetical protein
MQVIYLLSTIVQLRASFPPAPAPSAPSPGDGGMEGGGGGADEAVNLFSTIPAFTVFGPLFDWTFLLAASASLVVRWAAHRMNGPKEY